MFKKIEGFAFDNVKEVVVYNEDTCIFESHLFCPGNDSLGKHYVYRNGEIIFVGDLPYNFVGGAAIEYRDEIHLIGGGIDNLANDNGFYHYKLSNGKWIKIEDTLPINNLDKCTGFIYNDEIHIFGGSSYFITHLIYDSEKWVEGETNLTRGIQDNDVSVYFDGMNFWIYFKDDDDNLLIWKNKEGTIDEWKCELK